MSMEPIVIEKGSKKPVRGRIKITEYSKPVRAVKAHLPPSYVPDNHFSEEELSKYLPKTSPNLTKRLRLNTDEGKKRAVLEKNIKLTKVRNPEQR